VTVDVKVPRIVLQPPLLQRLGSLRPRNKPSRRHQRKADARRRFRDLHTLSSYLPGLDGLRALALLAVLVYHARPGWLPGGFLGVEVFFVISGFIITRGLLQEWQDRGRISLRAFWLRRARRLLPALFLLLVAVMAYASLFEPEAVAGLRGDVLAALAYVTNWHLILGNQSYFEGFSKPSMLRHLWSLAVEEQFYVVWPIFLAFCLPILKKNMTFVLIIAATIAASVAMALLYEPGRDASRVYYGTDTRAASLLSGAALAFLLSSRTFDSRIPRLLVALAGVAALTGLVVAACLLDEGGAFLYRGGFLGVSLLTTLAILAVTRPGRLSRLLGCAPLRWLGVRSYGMYLWHWPIFLLTWPSQAGIVIVGGQVLAVIIIAALSYELFEKPIREGALARRWSDLRDWRGLNVRYQSALAVGGSVAVALVVSLGLVAAMAKPPERPGYFALDGIRIRQSETSTSQAASLVPVSSFVTRFETSFAQVTSFPLPCPEGIAAAKACAGSPSLLVSVSFSPTDTPMGDAALADLPSIIKLPEPALTAAAKPLTLPDARPVPTDLPMVTAVGDSVMLGAAARLAGSLPNIDLDSQVGRQASAAISLLREREEEGRLGQVVLVHIGNNGSLTRSQFEDIMSILGDERQVIFLNLQVPRDWQDSNNAVLEQGVPRHPNATLIDWHGLTMDHPELFANDRIHLNGQGAELYTRLIIEAVLG